MRKMLILLVLLALVAGTLPAVVAASNPEPKEEPAAASTGPAPASSPGVCGAEAGWPGPDGFGYIGEVIAFDWVEISGTGTPVYLADDDYDGPFPIGFTFGFYGADFSDFYTGSNGFISFGAGSTSLSNQCPLPSSTTPDNLIALMWDDLDPGDTSDAVYYQTFGTCPTGSGACLVVQYENFHHYPGGGAIAGTFEAILFDNGEIIIQFEDAGAEEGSGSTTGIEDGNAGADFGLTYACDAALSLTDGLALKFGFPEGVYLNPGYQDGLQEPGSSADYDLTIMNFTGFEDTMELSYSAMGAGTCGGPGFSDAIPNGASWDFAATVDMDPGAVPGDTVTCEVYAFAPLSGYEASATIEVTAGYPIEAFGQDLFNDNTVYWPDLASPGTWSVVGYTPPSFYAGADFLGDNYDFMYGVNYYTNEFVAIDTATGGVTVIATSVPTGNWSGLTGAPDGSALYGVSSVCGTESYLYQIDPTNGALTLIGPMRAGSCMIDMAMNAEGELYGVDIIDDSLYQIDPGTGAATLVGSTGASANYAQGMDFDATTGILYWAAYTTGGELRTIDLATGFSTLIGGFPSGSEVDGLSIPGAAAPPEDPMFGHLWLKARPTPMGYRAIAVVRVKDAYSGGFPVEGAAVEFFLKNPDGDEWTETVYTNMYGTAKAKMDHPTGGPWRACIENITHPDYYWDPADFGRCKTIWFGDDPPPAP